MNGYVRDVAWPAMFQRETSPLWIATILTAIGQRAPDVERPFRYLDLGCGAGLNIALLAAGFPAAHFTGIDFNPAHVAEAAEWAATLPNLTVRCTDFTAFAAESGPGFDFIVANGVYSWISAPAREAVRAIVRQRLRPGGVLYLHYTSHPGQSVFAGAQAMLRRASAQGGSEDRLRYGLRLLAALERAGAGYFAAQPEVGRMLLREGGDSARLAHDILAADWAALHSGDVIADMEAIGCAFAGSATLLDNVDALSLPDGLPPLIARLPDIAARETARDIARNQSVRRDLYGHGVASLSAAEWRARIGRQVYRAMPRLAGSGDLAVETRIGPASVDAAMVDPIRDRLAAGPASFDAIAALHPAGGQPALLLRAFLMLIEAGEIHPAMPGGGAAEALNRLMVERGTRFLAAPAAGSAIGIAAEDAESLRRFFLGADVPADFLERGMPMLRSLRILPG